MVNVYYGTNYFTIVDWIFHNLFIAWILRFYFRNRDAALQSSWLLFISFPNIKLHRVSVLSLKFCNLLPVDITFSSMYCCFYQFSYLLITSTLILIPFFLLIVVGSLNFATVALYGVQILFQNAPFSLRWPKVCAIVSKACSRIFESDSNAHFACLIRSAAPRVQS